MTIEEFAKRSAQRAYLEKECRDADTISRKLFDQIKWERDLAVSQLEALGYGLGEKPKTDGDLISRQAAFEALNCINGTAELDKAFEAIESLPSAHPTRETRSNTLGALENRWIPVSERLPDDDRDVLVQMSDGCMGVDSVAASSSGWFWSEKDDLPVAWCELPEPYQEESV